MLLYCWGKATACGRPFIPRVVLLVSALVEFQVQGGGKMTAGDTEYGLIPKVTVTKQRGAVCSRRCLQTHSESLG